MQNPVWMQVVNAVENLIQQRLHHVLRRTDRLLVRLRRTMKLYNMLDTRHWLLFKPANHFMVIMVSATSSTHISMKHLGIERGGKINLNTRVTRQKQWYRPTTFEKFENESHKPRKVIQLQMENLHKLTFRAKEGITDWGRQKRFFDWLAYYVPAPRMGALSDDARLTSLWCLTSVCRVHRA